MEKATASTLKLILLSAAVILLLVLASWIWKPPDTYVPEELVGEWHSSDPNYADRSFEIDSMSISFRTGGGTVTTGFIKKVAVVPQGNKRLYTISYEADDAPNQVSFYYEMGKVPVIHFRNQENTTWTKYSSI